RGPVVRVDYDFDAVADVVERVAGDVVVPRVRKIIRLGKTIDYPEQPSFTGDDDVGIFVVSQKRRHTIHDVANVSIDQDVAVAGNSIRKRQLREIADGPRQHHATQTIADTNAARALV